MFASYAFRLTATLSSKIVFRTQPRLSHLTPSIACEYDEPYNVASETRLNGMFLGDNVYPFLHCAGRAW